MRWRSLAAAAVLSAGLLPRCLAQPAPVPAAVPSLTVRGTVEAIDLRRTAFVLRVQTHTRIVYLSEYADTTGLGASASSPVPVHLKERVSVGGSLQPDGTVLAGLVTTRILSSYAPEPGTPNCIVFGMVSGTSSKLRGRDIKVGAANGTETKVKVGRGISIVRAGQPISVHDLSRRDEVRVIGTFDGTDLKAARIDVLPPVPAPTIVPSPVKVPSRPGL